MKNVKRFLALFLSLLLACSSLATAVAADESYGENDIVLEDVAAEDADTGDTSDTDIADGSGAAADTQPDSAEETAAADSGSEPAEETAAAESGSEPTEETEKTEDEYPSDTQPAELLPETEEISAGPSLAEDESGDENTENTENTENEVNAGEDVDTAICLKAWVDGTLIEDGESMTYDFCAHTLAIDVTNAAGDPINYTEYCTVTYAKDGVETDLESLDLKNAGTVTVTAAAKDDSGYTGTATISFTIAPKPVTITGVTDTLWCGSQRPSELVCISGVVENDKFTPDYTVTCGYDPDTSLAGTYAVEVEADERQGNYTVATVDGALTVIGRPGLKAVGYDGVYDGERHYITVYNVKAGDTIRYTVTDDSDVLVCEGSVYITEDAEEYVINTAADIDYISIKSVGEITVALTLENAAAETAPDETVDEDLTEPGMAEEDSGEEITDAVSVVPGTDSGDGAETEAVEAHFTCSLGEVTLLVKPLVVYVATGSSSLVAQEVTAGGNVSYTTNAGEEVTAEFPYAESSAGAGRIEIVSGETLVIWTTSRLAAAAADSIDNEYSYQWEGGAGNGVINYNIEVETTELGTLSVIEADAVEVEVDTSGLESHIYNGEEHKWIPAVKTAAADGEKKTLSEGYAVTYSTGDFTDAGTIAVTVELKGSEYYFLNDDGYKVSSLTYTYTIDPAGVTIETGSGSKLYDGAPLQCTDASISGLVYADEEKGGAAVQATTRLTNAGTIPNDQYVIYWGEVNGSNYEVTKEIFGELTVERKNIESSADGVTVTVSQPEDVTYNGTTQLQPVAVTTSKNAVLEKDADYSVTYAGGLDAGTVTVTVAGIGNYDGTITRTYEIKKAEITIQTESAKDTYYRGIMLTAGGTLTFDGVEHSFGYGADNAASVTLFDTDEVTDQVKVYTKNYLTAAGSMVNEPAIEAADGASLDNYTIVKEYGTLTVERAAIPDGEIVLTAEDWIYGDSSKITYTYSDSTLYGSVKQQYYEFVGGEWTEIDGAPSDAGAYKVEMTWGGAGNYTPVTKTAQFTIARRALNITVASASKNYGEEDPPYTGSVENIMEGDENSVDIAYVRTNGDEDAGVYEGVLTVDEENSDLGGNYCFGKIKNGDFTIEQITAPSAITVRNVSVSYDGQPHAVTAVGSDGDTLEYSTDRNSWTEESIAFTDVGTYTVYIRVSNTNYKTYTLVRTVTITSKAVWISVEDVSIEVGSAAPEAWTVVFKDAKGNVLDLSEEETAALIEALGGYEITCGYDPASNKITYYPITITTGTSGVSCGNYTVYCGEDSGGVLSVYRRAVTVSGYTGVYDGAAHFITVSDLADGDTVYYSADGENWSDENIAFTDATGGSQAVYVQVIDSDGELQYSTVSYVNIQKATLTVATDSASKTFDGTALTAGGSITGFVNGETAALNVTGSITAPGETVNAYEIVWDTARESNYDIVEVLGTLTVYKIDISDSANGITAALEDLVYNGRSQQQSFVLMQKGEPIGSENYTVAYGDALNAGVVTVTVTGVGDYYRGSMKLYYRITPAALTVTTESAEKVYDGTALTAGGTIEGLVGNDSVSFTVTGSQTDVGSSRNTYAIDWGECKAGNYSVAVHYGTLTVTERDVASQTVVLDPAEMTYNGGSLRWSPVVTTEDGTILTENVDYIVTYSTSDFTRAGTVAVTITGIGDCVGTVETSYTIERAILTVTTESAEKVYDGTALTAGGAIEGLVEGDTVTFTVTGSQTDVGSSRNTYSLVWNGTASADNYTVEIGSIGTLTVTAAAAAAGTGAANDGPEEARGPADTNDSPEARDPAEANDGGAEAEASTVLEEAQTPLSDGAQAEGYSLAEDDTVALDEDETPLADSPIEHTSGILYFILVLLALGIALYFIFDRRKRKKREAELSAQAAAKTPRDI